VLPFDHLQRDPQALQQWHAFIVKEKAGSFGLAEAQSTLELSSAGNHQLVVNTKDIGHRPYEGYQSVGRCSEAFSSDQGNEAAALDGFDCVLFAAFADQLQFLRVWQPDRDYHSSRIGELRQKALRHAGSRG